MLCVLILAGNVAAARAEGFAPVEGPWVGTTSHGQPVSFEVTGGNVVDAHFRFDWGECGTHEDRYPNTDPIDAGGHWSYLDPSASATIEGTFVAPDRLEGAVVTAERHTPSCFASRDTFVAAPGEAPPQAFAVQNANTLHIAKRPSRIILRPDTLTFSSLRWQSFGGRVAYARGTAFIRRGKTAWRPRATVRLSSLIKDGPGTRIYSTMRWVLHGAIPHGFARRGLQDFSSPSVSIQAARRWRRDFCRTSAGCAGRSAFGR
jgi:hypothetical protein